MLRRWLALFNVLWPLGLILAAGFGAAQEAARPVPTSLEKIARELWALTELILTNHVDPPTRQQMFLTGAKSLVKDPGGPSAADLSRRASRIATEEQLAAFLGEIGPAASAGKDTRPDDLEMVFRNGMFQNVPGRTTFLPPDRVLALERTGGNRYVGTGIQLGIDPKEQIAQIVTPIRRGPVHRAGGRPRDLILEVDGVSTKGLDLRQVVEMLQGEEGTKVSMVVRQPGETATRTLHIARSVIPFEEVMGYRRGAEDGWEYRIDPAEPIAYAYVSRITSSALNELRQLERTVRDQGIRALVLDLRFTSGDDLHNAALMADGLLAGGVLWQTRDARGQVKVYRADPDCLCRDCNLAILIGPQTGKSAELVAAALHDNERAVLVGEKTRGDGGVESLVPLPDPGRGSLLLRAAVVERAKTEPPSHAEAIELLRQRAAGAERAGVGPRGWGVAPVHAALMSNQQRTDLFEWLHRKNLTELPPHTDDKPPEDPPLARAVELLRAALKAAEPKPAR